MDSALILAAAALGVAGVPHCAAMCGPTCVALVSGSSKEGQTARSLAFLAARTAGYAAAGALAAASVGTLSTFAHETAWLRPLWGLLHAGAMALGLWLLITGRQPHWMSQLGRARGAQAHSVVEFQSVAGPRRWPAGMGRCLGAGMLWVAWPCGLLQSALLVASLGNSPGSGALAMAVFAVISALPLHAAPWLWTRMSGGRQAGFQTLAVRLAGALLVFGSGFALGKDLWHQVASYCGF
jgi:uncharacterized protein